MPGPTAWQQNIVAVNFGTQSITTTTETVICTLSGLASRQAGNPIFLQGWAAFAVNASTTSTVLRIRQDSLTGALVSNTAPFTATAGTTSAATSDVNAQDSPALEYENKTYVLTIQATAAAANWNVTAATLIALY